eukprot:1125673-Rhodomonas_salina.2
MPPAPWQRQNPLEYSSSHLASRMHSWKWGVIPLKCIRFNGHIFKVCCLLAVCHADHPLDVIIRWHLPIGNC